MMENTRRTILAGIAAVTLAACVPTVETAGDTSSLNVQQVQVDTSNLVLEGRDLPNVTRERAKRDFEAAMTKALAVSSDPAGTPVTVSVSMTKMHLASAMERVVAGTSSATGVLTVTEVGTGRRIVAPTEITGNTENFRGISLLGAATTPNIEKDYNGTINGFAETVRKALFGSDT